MITHRQLALKIGGRSWRVPTLFSIALLLFAATSQAALLPVGGQVIPGAEALPAGMTQVAGGVPVAFGGLGFSGMLTSTVWTNDSTNPFGADRMTFTYLISNAADSAHVVDRLTISSYAGFMADISYTPTGSGVPPAQADRSTADVIGFNFVPTFGAGPILPGSESRLLVVQTDSTVFAESIASAINGGVSMMPSFAPIPEPATWALALIGLAGLLGLVRRIRK